MKCDKSCRGDETIIKSIDSMTTPFPMQRLASFWSLYYHFVSVWGSELINPDLLHVFNNIWIVLLHLVCFALTSN